MDPSRDQPETTCWRFLLTSFPACPSSPGATSGHEPPLAARSQAPRELGGEAPSFGVLGASPPWLLGLRPPRPLVLILVFSKFQAVQSGANARGRRQPASAVCALSSSGKGLHGPRHRRTEVGTLRTNVVFYFKLITRVLDLERTSGSLVRGIRSVRLPGSTPDHPRSSAVALSKSPSVKWV